MARVKYQNFAVDSSGDVISGAQVEVRDTDNNLATLYEAETGATEAYAGANPFSAGDGTPDKVGRFEFWIDEGVYNITVGSGASAVTDRIVLSSETLATDAVGNDIEKFRYLGTSTEGLRLQRALDDLATETRKSARVLVYADSFGIKGSNRGITMQMPRFFEPWMSAQPFYAPDETDLLLNSGTPLEGAFNPQLQSAGSTASLVEKTTTGYDEVNPIGTYVQIESGEVAAFWPSNRFAFCDRIYIPVYTYVGGGTIKIEIAKEEFVSGATFTNPAPGEVVVGPALTGGELLVDTDAAVGVTVIELAFSEVQRVGVKITHDSGGTARVDQPMHEVTDGAAVNVWRYAVGSNDFADATTQGFSNASAVIAAYEPDIIIVDSNDVQASYENFLPKLETAISDAGLSIDPIVMLPQAPFLTGSSPSQDDMRVRARYCDDFVQSRIGWTVIEGLKFSGGLTEVTMVGYENDGVHYGSELAWLMLEKWAYDNALVRPELVRPGGDATQAQMVDGTDNNLVTAARARDLLLQPSRRGTDTLTWAFNASGSASGTDVPAGGYMDLSTGATAGSDVVAYVNSSILSLGRSTRSGFLGQDDMLGFAFRFALDGVGTNFEAYLSINTRGVGAAYAGALTSNGVGFRIQNNVLAGIAYRGAQNVTSTTHTLPANDYVDAFAILSPNAIISTRGTADFYVRDTNSGADAIYLGQLQYDTTNMRAPRIEMTNGADAADYGLRVAYPEIVSI